MGNKVENNQDSEQLNILAVMCALPCPFNYTQGQFIEDLKKEDKI